MSALGNPGRAFCCDLEAFSWPEDKFDALHPQNHIAFWCANVRIFLHRDILDSAKNRITLAHSTV
jgi:hypothetical protein